MNTKIGRTSFSILVAALLALTLAFASIQPAQAASCSVTSALDDGKTGSLRFLLADPTCEMITFAGDTTIRLNSPLTIEHKLTVDGGGYQVVISGDTNGDGKGETYLFDVPSGMNATLQNLVLEKGSGKSDVDGYFYGGAIYNQGTLAVTGVTFSANNSAYAGGAIYNQGTLAVTDSTFTGNSADGGGAILNYAGAITTVTNSTFSGNSSMSGGVIYNYSTGTVTVTGSSFTGNSATSSGGVIENSGTLTVTNSTFSGNSARFGGAFTNSGRGTVQFINNTFVGNTASSMGGVFDTIANLTLRNNIIARAGSVSSCSGSATASSNLTDDPGCTTGFTKSSTLLLGTLGSYGGGTQTIPLLPGSAAIDAGNSTYCSTTDQRGVARVGTCDIGAFESQGFSLSAASGSGQMASLSTAFPNPLVVTISSAHAEPVDGGMVTFTAPADGASTDPAVNTASIAGGQASLSATANATNGGYTVLASAAGAASASFSLENYNCNALTVTNDNDSGSGSLREAIGMACAGGTISFDGDYTIHLASTLTLSRDVTIDGGDHAIVISGDTDNDGTGDVRVFYVNAGVTAALQNLGIEKGNAGSQMGGGIFNNGTLSVSGSSFSGNSAVIGGAIANWYQCTLTVTDSTFIGNSSTTTNISYGGGGINNRGTLTISESTFSGNTAAQGGGIHNYVSDGRAVTVVTNSTFSGNSASYGGGIGNSMDAELTVTNSTFSSNSASNRGGGILNIGNSTVTNSTFSGNSAGTGGGFYQYSGTATIRNSLIANSMGGNCGGYIIGSDRPNNLADDASCGDLFTNRSTILLGTLGSYGGSTQTIPLLPGSAAIDAGGSTYCPAADQRGVGRMGTCDIGAFESQGFSLAASAGDNQQAYPGTAFPDPLQVTISSAHAEPVEGGAVTFSAPATGASASLAGSPATITDGLASATATANSTFGTYAITASAKGATSISFSLENYCGAALVVTNGGDSGSGSLREAIGMACAGGTISFDGDYTIHLASTLTLSRDVTIDGGDHAIVISGDTDNDGTGDVRVFYVNAGVTAALQNLGIEKGNAGSQMGGAIFNNGTLSVTGSTFSGNSADIGGAILNNGTLSVTGSTFAGNSNTSSLSGGGGINNRGTLTVSESTFSGNMSPYLGGGILNDQYAEAVTTVTNSTFSGNSAPFGGGIGNGGDAELTVTNSTFSGNSADIGGAILNNGTLAVTNSTFSGNNASNQGGGIYNSSAATVTNSTLSGNSAGTGGGFYQYSGTATIRNSLIANSMGGNCSGYIIGSDRPTNLADDPSCGSYFTIRSTILLGTLGSYGGSTQTIPLLPGSYAIDKGSSSYCPATDQRGVARPLDGDGNGTATCDIGAFETRGFSLARTGGTLQSTPVNSAFAQPLQVSLRETGGELLPGGLVTFTGPATGASTNPAIFTAPADASGVTQAIAIANSLPGAYILTAKAGGSNTLEFFLTNTKASATVSLVSSPNPSMYKQRVTFTATVSGGSILPTGTVAFYENTPGDAISQALEQGDVKHAVALAEAAGATGNVVTLDSNGVATFTSSSLTVGSHSLVAIYSGDANYDTSSSNILDQGVSKAPAVITQPTSQTVVEGSEVSFSAEAIGYPDLAVQWQVSSDSGRNWANLDGATATPLTFSASFTQNGNQYRVIFSNDLGSVTSDPAALTVNAVSGLGSISGLVFNDTNGNGTQDRGEAGLAGWTVQLKDPNGSLIQEVVTDSGGVYNYSFSVPGGGIFRVRPVLQPGYVQTTQEPADINLVDGQAVTGINFGAVLSADLSVSMEYTYDAGTKAIVYTITVTNDGPAEAAAVSLKDALSRYTSYVSAISTLGTCSNKSGTVTCTLGNLASGSSATITLTVTRTSLKYAILNTATLSSSIFDFDKADNSVKVTIQ